MMYLASLRKTHTGKGDYNGATHANNLGLSGYSTLVELWNGSTSEWYS
jgi:hypothetical protein